MMPPSTKTAKKLTGSVIAIIILTVCLAITSSALTSITFMVSDNSFSTGVIDIDISGSGVDKRIINGEAIAPGMTITKTFTITNNSTDDVYYKLYFENISGGLKDLIEVTIKDGTTALPGYEKRILSTLTEKNVQAVNVPIPKSNAADADAHQKTLTISFYLPSDVEKGAYTLDLSFDFSVRAVQSRNQNPNDKIYFGDEASSSETATPTDPAESATNQ